MAKDDLTHFQFDFGGISLELSGEREFVELMYRKVMNDVELVRAGRHRPNTAPTTGAHAAVGADTPRERKPAPRTLWIHRCSEMMRKIYLATTHDLDQTVLRKVVDSDELAMLYVDKAVMNELLPHLDAGQTMWAEFTEAGRKILARAANPDQAG